MRWRIYYGDGTTCNGETLDEAMWAPRLNVQVIWNENPKGSEGGGIVHKRDYYIYKDGRWWGCNEDGYRDYKYHHMGPTATIYGRTVSDDAYNDLVQRALKEKLGV